MLASPQVAGTPATELVRALDVGVAVGLFDVSVGPVPEVAPDLSGPVRIPSAFNDAMLRSDSLGGRPVALASTVTGTGHTLGDLEAAILDELVARGRDGLAERVDTRLVGSGRALQKDGKPVTDAAERVKRVEEACRTFEAMTLPVLARLGIVTAV